ncbi:lachesin-like [Babylonia areolata]|uniref:lachesin-like n=1 Tax=Babylonia areolata TaxID=304850 RepID=UPI003FD65907
MDLLTLFLLALLMLVGLAQEEVPLLNLDEVELSGPMPRFLPTPTFYSVGVGQTAILQCAVVELDDKKVIWRRASDSNPLTVGCESFREDNRIMSEHEPDSDYWNLLIHKVKLSDAGVYECQVSSKLRHLRHHVLLQVHEREISTTAPRPSISLSGPDVLDKDNRLELSCNATGQDYPPDDLDWFKEGNKLTTSADEKLFIRKFVSLTDKTIFSTLEIRDAQLEDSGLYICRTSNLQVRSLHVTVLDTGTNNVKRGTHKGLSGGAACLFPQILTSITGILLLLMGIGGCDYG